VRLTAPLDEQHMATNTDAFSDIDKKSLNNGGPSAKRRINLKKYDAPLHVLDKLGVDIPHREYHPEDSFEYPTTVVCESENNTARVSLFQDVKEDMDDSFGDFGAVAEDEEDDDVVWTVSDLTDGTVSLMVVGEWSKRREIEYSTFAENYEPVTVTTPHGEVPQLGY